MTQLIYNHIFAIGLSGVAQRLCPWQIEPGPERELRPQVREEVEGGKQQDRVDSSADRGQFHIFGIALFMVQAIRNSKDVCVHSCVPHKPQ